MARNCNDNIAGNTVGLQGTWVAGRSWMMIIAGIRSTHSKRRARFRLCQDATLFRSSRIVRSRDNSHSWEFSLTYVLSRKDLKTSAGPVFAVEDWRRYRSSSLVNASGCIQKTYRWRTRPNPRPFQSQNSKFQSSIYSRSRLGITDSFTTLVHFDNIFFLLKQDLWPFLIETDNLTRRSCRGCRSTTARSHSREEIVPFISTPHPARIVFTRGFGKTN